MNPLSIWGFRGKGGGSDKTGKFANVCGVEIDCGNNEGKGGGLVRGKVETTGRGTHTTG